MNGILGFASLIQVETDEVISPLTAYYAEIINDNCKSLLQLLDDIIDLSKLQSNQLKIVITESNLNTMLSNLHLLYNQRLHEKGKTGAVEIIREQQPEDETVMIDSIRLQQVLTNLFPASLSNT
jgi:two-component system CheB/CheR fusion protein